MTPTSRAILQTVLATDSSLSQAERRAVERLIEGTVEVTATAPAIDEHALITQKRAAELLSVSRATIWRMTKDHQLHPVELIPGTWRYTWREIIALTQKGTHPVAEVSLTH